MMNLPSDVELLRPALVTFRRELHRYPELAFEERRTAAAVARKLSELGLEVKTGVGKTGVVGLLDGDQDGPTVMVRCDMDALPIHEQGTAEYVSQTPGKMHACGHDGHTAIAVAVAELLARRRGWMRGRVKFVFQPAEEIGLGALAMIEDGVLDTPTPDVCFGLHLWNELPLGHVAVTPGPIMAGADSLHVTIEGRGGHGALPHLVADPVLTIAQSIVALQSVISRNISPLETAVVSITQLQAGTAVNVIPDSGEFHGTIRTFTPETRALVMERLETLITATARSMGCRASVSFEMKSPPVLNDPQVAARLDSLITANYPDLTRRPNFRTMAAEDMAFFLEKVPGIFFLVGSANAARQLNFPHHHPQFDFDEQALVIGASLMASAVAAYVLPGSL